MFLLSIGKMTKQDIKEILSIKGEVRGRMVQHTEALEKMAGKEALEKVEKLLEGLGYPMPKEKLREIRFYKIGEAILYLMAIKEVLGWDKKKFEEMGRIVGKNLVIIKYLSPFFQMNKNFFFKKIPEFSNRFFKDLRTEPIEVSLEKKEGMFKITGLNIKNSDDIIQEAEEIATSYFSGLFASWAQTILGTENVSCRLIKDKQGDYIFKITWR